MGLDSLTLKNIGRRTGPINDLAYIKYGLQALMKLNHPVISIEVDGELVVQRERGYFIIANSSEYAKNLLLLPEANPSEKSLTLGFLPNANYFHELQKSWWMARQKPAKLPLRKFTGSLIKLTLHDNPYPLQVDGDYYLDKDLEADSMIYFKIADKTIRVLSELKAR
ncbi:MAG: hypothetical protein R3A13_09505 [Bdellovibrionota bacterium]